MQCNGLLNSKKDSFSKYNLNKSDLSTNAGLVRSIMTYFKFKN